MLVNQIRALKIPFEAVFQKATDWQRAFRTGDTSLHRKAKNFMRTVSRHVLQVNRAALRTGGG